MLSCGFLLIEQVNDFVLQVGLLTIWAIARPNLRLSIAESVFADFGKQLSDHGDIATRGHCLHKGLCAALGDGAQIVDELVPGGNYTSCHAPCMASEPQVSQ